jgi:hypothetical protein
LIIVVIIIGVKDRWYSKAKKQLMIVDGEGNNFIMNYEQLLEKYMEANVIWSSSIMWQQHENEFDILRIQ